MKRFEAKVALVTGASRGIGLAIARRLASEGATVLAAARNAAALESAASDIASAAGRAFPLPLDLTDRASIENAVKSALAAHGQIDVLVNNGGITRDNLVLRMSGEAWDQVNRHEPDRELPPDSSGREIHGSQALWPHRQRGSGRRADG